MTTPHEVRPHDPLVRWMVATPGPLSAGPVCVADGANVAWLGRAARPGEKWVTGLGEDPRTVVGLVQQLAAEHPVDGVTVSEPAFALLPDHLRSPDPGMWCFWTLDRRDARIDDSRTVDLALDDPRIAPLLEHSASAHIFPGDPRLVRWAGAVDGDRLVAVAGQVTEASGAAHVVSVCTDPQERGRGLARRVCSRLVRAAIADDAPMIVLEMYTANEPGRRAYAALGFVERGRYASGLLPHALAAMDQHPDA